MTLGVTKLLAARMNRGWKPAQVITMLRLHAVADQVPIASTSSLRIMLWRWEHGQVTPRLVYRRLLCKVYAASPDELGIGAVTRLHAARLIRGCTRSEVIAMLCEKAAADRIPIATASSLKTMLSRWEHADGTPGAVYRRLLCQVYDASPDQLGLRPPHRTTSNDSTATTSRGD